MTWQLQAFRFHRARRHWRFLLWNYLRIRCDAFHSFRGHIRIQSATAPPSVDYGPALEHLGDGHYQPHAKTIARADSTEKLRATMPWVDIADQRIFLMGFDAGEQFVHSQKEVRSLKSGGQ